MARRQVLCFLIVFTFLNEESVHADLNAPCANASSCCQCVSSPGCSWFYNTNLPRPYCGWTIGDTVRDPELEQSTPYTTLSEMSIIKSQPMHQGSGRLIRPQKVLIKQSVGVRQEISFQMMGTNRVLRFKVIDSTNGAVNFTVKPAFSDTCHAGFYSHMRGARGNLNRRMVVTCIRGAPGPGDTSDFKITLNTVACTNENQHFLVIRHNARNLKRLRIDFNSMCTCPKSNQAAEESPEMEICNSVQPANEDDECQNERCIAPDGNQMPCSGRGTCICGECLCDFISNTGVKKYSGQYCELNDWFCPFSHAMLCGGPTRGRCANGNCVCFPGLSGEACEVELNMNCSPYPNYDGPVCSGHGICNYGFCQCEGEYAGPFCDQCPTCVGHCEQYAYCVQCFYFSQEPQEECYIRCNPHTSEFRYRMVEDLVEVPGHLCIVADRDQGTSAECRYHFSYQFEDNEYNSTDTILSIRRHAECDPVVIQDGSSDDQPESPTSG